jgi:hypothetical protein
MILAIVVVGSAGLHELIAFATALVESPGSQLRIAAMTAPAVLIL